MAHQLWQASSSHQTPQILTPSGVTTDPKKINDQFKQFYSSLYASELHTNLLAFDSFLNSLDINKVDQDSVGRLEKPLTVNKHRGSAFSMQLGKCPGPEGFPTEFYKTFFDKLAPVLIEMFNESFNTLNLPPTLNQASISLILKKNKDPLSCSSYRPISLLSVDVKLLSKLLAMRSALHYLPRSNRVYPEQTFFF